MIISALTTTDWTLVTASLRKQLVKMRPAPPVTSKTRRVLSLTDQISFEGISHNNPAHATIKTYL